jgi:hypothetical protein
MTVLVVPFPETEEIVAVLADYAAVGLLAPFVWVDAANVGGAATAATLVRGGRAEPVILQQLLTAQRYARIRVAVLVPVQASATARVPLAVEQAVEEIAYSSAVGTPVSLLRVLLTNADVGSATADPPAVLEGWHNVVVAPEDSPGPGLGTVAWGPMTDSLDFAQACAPVIAGMAGLWAGLEETPFDTLEVLPGQTMRAVRAFYRHLDTSKVEERLRRQLFDPAGRLPLPRGGAVPVVYVNDAAMAARTMARALWTKHRDVLRGPRITSDSVGVQTVSIRAALKIFFKFMGAALRSAPGAWWSAVTGSVTSVLAHTVQGTVFGGKDSAYAVVARTDVTDWQDLGAQADTLSSALGGDSRPEHLAQADLSALWIDFANAALTLADGGRRTGGLEPIEVGSGVGVLARAADVVPSVAERFSAIPTSLSAVIGVSAVEPVDVLGAANLHGRLQRAYQDSSAGVEARTADAALERWQGVAAKSYGWQVGSILADFLHRARAEVTELADKIEDAAKRVSVDERLRARQQAIGVILRTFVWGLLLILAVLAVSALAGWVRWKFALWTGGVMLGFYVVASLALFLLAQRDHFAEMNLRNSQIGELERMQANLRSALADVSRLSTAYGQLLCWSRVLGAVLRAPFGPPPAAHPSPAELHGGLPRSTQLGVATPSAQQTGDAIHIVQARLYALGWLTEPWQEMITAAAHQLREEPEMLFRMPGSGTHSGLDQWSADVASGKVQPTGAHALWTRVEQMFTENSDGIADALTGTVLLPSLGRQVAAWQFRAGTVDGRPGAAVRAVPFHASLFTSAATTAGRCSVAVDHVAVARDGLGHRAAIVQATDGLPPYDFAIFEPRTTPGTAAAMRSGISPGQDMVF